MANIIKLIDGSAIGIGPAAVNLKRGLREGSTLSAVESAFEIGGAFSTLTSYFGKGLANLSIICGIFYDHIPSIISALGIAMNSVAGRAGLGAVGIVTCTFRIVRESISLARQKIFLEIFQRNAWQGAGIRNALAETVENVDNPFYQKSLPLKFRTLIVGKKEKLEELLKKVDAGDLEAQKKAEKVLSRWTGRNIRDCLEEINDMPLVEIERSLPIWLYQDIVDRGGKEYLNRLLQKVYRGDQKATIEATKLLNDMQSYATKKQIVHILRIIGAAIGLISCLGFFITFPFILTVVFMVLITIVSTAAYLANAGYVENREDGFSLTICIPEFVRNIPATIKSIPGQIVAYIEGRRTKKPLPSSYQMFEKYRIAEAMPEQMERIRLYSAERLKRQARLRSRAIRLAASAA